MEQTLGQFYTQEGGIEVLTELLAAKFGTAMTAHLYKSTFSPAFTSSYADFLAADATFTGYTPQAVTFGTVGVTSAGQPILQGDATTFTAGSPLTVTDTIGGVWVEIETESTPSVVHKGLAWAPFNSPLTIGTPLQQVVVDVVAMLLNFPGYFQVTT